MTWDFEDQRHWPWIIKEVTGIDPSIISEMDSEQIRLAVTMIAYSVTERKESKLPDFNLFTLGQWVDMEYYLAQGLDRSIRDCLRIIGKETDAAQEALWIIESYIEWRSSVYKQYAGLFGSEQDEDLDEEPVKANPNEIAKGWYKIIVTLANENILEIDRVQELPIRKAFNFMALQKEKQLAELMRLKQNRQKYDLQKRY